MHSFCSHINAINRYTLSHILTKETYHKLFQGYKITTRIIKLDSLSNIISSRPVITDSNMLFKTFFVKNYHFPMHFFSHHHSHYQSLIRHNPFVFFTYSTYCCNFVIRHNFFSFRISHNVLTVKLIFWHSFFSLVYYTPKSGNAAGLRQQISTPKVLLLWLLISQQL